LSSDTGESLDWSCGKWRHVFGRHDPATAICRVPTEIT
jgi:hypothetical protein